MGTSMSSKIALFFVLFFSCIFSVFAIDCTDNAKCDPFTPPQNPFSDASFTAWKEWWKIKWTDGVLGGFSTINREKTIKTIPDIIKEVLKYVWIIWMIVVMYAWMNYMLTAWKQEDIKKNHNTLIYAWVWTLLAFTWYIVVDVINSIKIG